MCLPSQSWGSGVMLWLQGSEVTSYSILWLAGWDPWSTLFKFSNGRSLLYFLVSCNSPFSIPSIKSITTSHCARLCCKNSCVPQSKLSFSSHPLLHPQASLFHNLFSFNIFPIYPSLHSNMTSHLQYHLPTHHLFWTSLSQKLLASIFIPYVVLLHNTAECWKTGHNASVLSA